VERHTGDDTEQEKRRGKINPLAKINDWSTNHKWCT